MYNQDIEVINHQKAKIMTNMFQYQINKHNIKDLVLLPVSRYFDDIKIALIPFSNAKTSSPEVSQLLDEGYLVLGGRVFESDNNYFSAFRYLVKPSAEVMTHLEEIGTDSLSVTINKISGEDDGERNVVFSVSMPGSTSGMSHTAIAGSVMESDLQNALSVAPALSNLTDHAHSLFHFQHPNHKISNTNLNIEKTDVINSCRNLFVAISIQYDKSDIVKDINEGKYDFFYNSAEQMSLVESCGIKL